ncbi:hypothetical protein LP415_05100 [Polaromonas sp. P1(28)-8]|nr:hypothetical protein LP415_05100 [Polaromonas sp. P1(28)-8]
MTRKEKTSVKAKVKAKAGTPRQEDMPEEVAEPDADNGRDRIVARPDGYHWLTPDGKQEFGPFETVEQAREDMDAADERGAGAGHHLAGGRARDRHCRMAGSRDR